MIKKKIGVLGGGQLGRMLLQIASNWNLEIHILDPNPEAPCAELTPYFSCGDFTDFDAVYEFGQNLDLLTIEIEKVNTEALKKLQNEGKTVYPQPDIIETIQDKRLQKNFYHTHHIPTSDFILIESKNEIYSLPEFLPAFHKLGKGGYDGKGVQYIQDEKDIPLGFDAPGLLEKAVDVEKEISVIAARNPSGEIAIFPPVEMVFDPELNLVDYLLAPARLTEEQVKTAESLATQLIETLGMVGLLAVEMFLTPKGEILVNEIAPRTHNSGHHSIEANYTSQFEQHLRAILDLPLGNTGLKNQAAMINILGAPDQQGVANYTGFEKILAQDASYVHLYGKKMTKAGRKMGHITVLDENLDSLIEKVKYIKSNGLDKIVAS